MTNDVSVILISAPQSCVVVSDANHLLSAGHVSSLHLWSILSVVLVLFFLNHGAQCGKHAQHQTAYRLQSIRQISAYSAYSVQRNMRVVVHWAITLSACGPVP